MPLTGVESLPFLSRSTPLQRCHHKNLTDPLKLSDAYCQTCASWTDTSVALLRSESGRFAAFMVEQIRWTICSCTQQNEANFYKSVQWLAKLDYGGGIKCEGARLFSHARGSVPYRNDAAMVGGSASQQTSNTSAGATSQQTSAANTNQQTSNSANTSQQTSKKRNGSTNQQTSNKRNGSTKQQTNKRNGSTNQQTSAISDRPTN
jgi:hypothetical protein